MRDPQASYLDERASAGRVTVFAERNKATSNVVTHWFAYGREPVCELTYKQALDIIEALGKS